MGSVHSRHLVEAEEPRGTTEVSWLGHFYVVGVRGVAYKGAQWLVQRDSSLKDG